MATSGTSFNSYKSMEFPPSTSQTFFANSNAVGNLDAGGDSQAGSAGTGRPVVHVCYLFAGKHRESDLPEQIKVRLQGEGLLSEIDAFDLLRSGDSHDLSSIALREQSIEDIDNKYGIVVSSPPCNTYSRLNWSEDPGPRPIRCRTHPRGFPWLRQRFRWKLETANLLIDFNWEVLRKVHEISRTRPIIALMEHPEDLGATPKVVPAKVWQDASFQDLLRQSWFNAALGLALQCVSPPGSLQTFSRLQNKVCPALLLLTQIGDIWDHYLSLATVTLFAGARDQAMVSSLLLQQRPIPRGSVWL